MEKEIWCSLALKHTPGLGPRTWNKLISHFKSATQSIENIKEWGILNIRREIIRSVKNRQYSKEAHREYRLWERSQSNLLVLSQSDYPSLLKEIPDPPIILYYKGRKELLENPCIAIVGSRKTSAYGRQFSEKIARDLSYAGITVVSGLAIGIDTLAHKNGLLGNGSTIAVLGTGIDIDYPAQNLSLKKEIMEKALVVSEFPPYTPPCAENFPIRNRLISGLSLGVIVVQAAKKSGSLITARFALEQNRLVFSIPAPVNQPDFYGNNQLLRDGAILIRDLDDILKEIGPIISPKLSLKNNATNGKKELNNSTKNDYEQGDQGKIIKFLLEHEGATIDEMIEQMDIDASDIMATLVQLEILGKINKGPGNQYTLN